MTHVQIKSLPDGGSSVVVDGVEMNMKILAEGFAVEMSIELGQPNRVHMIVAADVLDLDLPDAVVTALRQEADNA